MENTRLINRNSMRFIKVSLYVMLGISLLLNIRFVLVA